MKNKKLIISIAVTSGLIACNPLSKMAKKSNTVNYSAAPNPLEMHADSISVEIKGQFPEKYFHKKVSVEIVPLLKYEGGEKELQKITLVGELVETEGIKISNNGGSFTFNEKFKYQKGMENAELVIKPVGTYKSKTKDLVPDEVKIADGTIVTPLLLQNDDKAIMAKDNFVKVKPVSYNAEINYLVNSSIVRPSELRDSDIRGLEEFIKKGIEAGYVFKNVSIEAYASPEGEISLNDNLANERAESAAKAVQSFFKKYKVDAADNESFYKKIGKGEDWEGFKELMQKSNIADKDVIIRILEMYSDLNKREQEIKNLSKTYMEIAEKILPPLRRSKIQINAEEKSRSDDEILKLAFAAPDSLELEELLYAATLTNDLNKKLSIYKNCTKVYPNEWRAYNNVGYILLLQKKFKEAEAPLKKAAKLSNDNPIVNNNLGVVERLKGNVLMAKEYYEKASAAGPEVKYNMGIINIILGDYASAVTNFSNEATFNSALANLLNGNTDIALKLLDKSKNDDAIVYYLKAIAGARTDNSDLLINNLKIAINKDASLKEKAKKDAEFIKYRDNADFQAIVQ